MKYFPCTTALGNFNCYSTAKGKRLDKFSLFFAALCTYPIYTGSKVKEKQKQRPNYEHLNRKNVYH